MTLVRASFWLATALMTLAAHAADWPRFLGPNADAKSAETGLLDRFPEAGPPVAWQKRIGTGYSSPSIKGDVLVLHHRIGNEEIVEAMKAKSGESIWKY